MKEKSNSNDLHSKNKEHRVNNNAKEVAPQNNTYNDKTHGIRSGLEKKISVEVKDYIILITYAVILYAIVANINAVKDFLRLIIGVLSPVLIGAACAYVLNIPMRFFERKLFKRLDTSKKPFVRKLKRPFSIITTYITVFIIITILIIFLVPQISHSILSLASNMNNYITSLQNLIKDLSQRFNLSGDFWQMVTVNWNEILTKGSQLLSATLPQIYSITKSLTNGIINIVMGLIVSVYILAKKEKLIRIMKQLIFAYVSKRTANKIVDTGAQFNKSFQGFIAGQITEAFILGALVFIGMLIFNFPYAVLCSVIITFTSIIPFFGAWLGGIPSAFIILMVDPSKVLWFIIFIIVLQQLEGNIIYPKVMGNSIGIDGLWVLISLIVGGSLFGIAGMILGIPVFAVIYTIIARSTKLRLNEREIDID